MRRLIAGLVTMVFVLSVAAKAHALAGDLKSAALAFPKDMPEALQTQIVAALNGKGAKFLEGHFVNAGTTLVYGGDTGALTEMLARLLECDGIQVTLSFVRGPVSQSWTLKHNAWVDPKGIGVQVNLDATGMDLQKLDLRVCSGGRHETFPMKQKAPSSSKE